MVLTVSRPDRLCAQSCDQVAEEQARIAKERDRGVPLATVYKEIEQSFPDNGNMPSMFRGLRTRFIEQRKTLAADIYKSGESAANVRDQAMHACEDLKGAGPSSH